MSLAQGYHVLGTDKVGQDVLYLVLKSIRTGLLLGTLTTLIMLPAAILLGILAGYVGGWVDDVIQYLYTTLNSIPDVLLIAAAVLMMQVVIDTHPGWFSSVAERADARLLALCIIMGVTSWTGLCRLLRGETLKLRELEYVQAAQAFGVSRLNVMLRHILPNLTHIVLITVVMDFSRLVLAEAVLSYVGVGVDPSTISFGTMIEGLKVGRYDALCINGWNSGGYASLLSQTIPLYYSALDAYTWAGNARFDNNLALANDPSVHISTIDGTGTKIIADQNFPKATQLTMPQMTDYVTALVNVADKKADLTFVERHLAFDFMKKNPAKIQKVKKDTPIRYYANGFNVDIGEYKLLAMFNMTLEEMLGAGDIDAILDRYRKDDPSSLLSIAKPFAE